MASTDPGLCKRVHRPFVPPICTAHLQSLGWGCHLGGVRIGIDVGGTKIEGLLLGDDGRETHPRTRRHAGRLRRRVGSGSHGRRDLEPGPPVFNATRRRGNAWFPPAGPGAHPQRETCSASTTGRSTRISRPPWAVRCGWPTMPSASSSREAIDGAAAPPAALDRPRAPTSSSARRWARGSAAASSSTDGSSSARTAPPPSGATPPCRFCGSGRRSPYVCFCGHPGCIQSFISGRGLAARYRTSGRAGPRRGGGRPPAKQPATPSPIGPSWTTRIGWRARWRW